MPEGDNEPKYTVTYFDVGQEEEHDDLGMQLTMLFTVLAGLLATIGDYELLSKKLEYPNGDYELLGRKLITSMEKCIEDYQDRKKYEARAENNYSKKSAELEYYFRAYQQLLRDIKNDPNYCLLTKTMMEKDTTEEVIKIR